MKTLIPFAAIALLAAAPALAAETARAELRYADLDLATSAGQAQLSARIDSAAAIYCTPQAVTGSRIAGRADSDCLAEVRGQLKARLAARLKRQGIELALKDR
jgi:UrcA family protein